MNVGLHGKEKRGHGFTDIDCVKDLERSLFWMILVGLKGTHIYPESEKGRGRVHTHIGEDNVKTEQRWECLKSGSAGSHRKLEKARNALSPKAF